jgi:hypothetical protein
MPRTLQALQQMPAVVEQLVSSSVAGHRYKKAQECVAAARAVAASQQLPDAFNTLLTGLCTK